MRGGCETGIRLSNRRYLGQERKANKGDVRPTNLQTNLWIPSPAPHTQSAYPANPASKPGINSIRYSIQK